VFSPLDLLWLALLGGGVLYLWRADKFKTRARELATDHCRQLDLQLLDQSMVITGLWPVRDESGRLEFRRRYRFEFSSVGDRRYQGEVVLVGMRLDRIDFETYKLPPEN